MASVYTNELTTKVAVQVISDSTPFRQMFHMKGCNTNL